MITLNFGPITLDQTCVVIPGFKYQVILGEDFLMQNKVIIDYHDHNLRVRGETLPFVSKNALTFKNTKNVLKVEARSQRTAVSYTHLTLPTILRV